MKRLLLILPFLVACGFSFSQKGSSSTFTLTGKIIGKDTGFVHIWYADASDKAVHDSVYLKNGVFMFSGNILQPTNAGLFSNVASASVDDPNYTDIFLEPKPMQATLKVNDFKHGDIKGSPTNDEWMVFTRRHDDLEKKWSHMWAGIKEAQAAHDTATLNRISDGEIPLYREERYGMFRQFIRDYPHSFTTPGLLMVLTSRTPLDTVKQLYSLLSPSVQQSTTGKEVGRFISREKATALGEEAPGFTQANADGKQVSLQDYRGKYVLLEFWASWCGPCREELPNLKKAYQNLSGKNFDILSISLDGDKSKWLTAVKQENLAWTQLCDFKINENEAVQRYNISSIPANFLINPEGKIIAKDLRGKDVESKLAALINK